MQQLTPWIQSRFYYKNSTLPLSGGFLRFYYTGTTNKAPTFQEKNGVVNPNPVPLDIVGEAQVWLSESIVYDIEILDADLALQDTRLGVSASSEGGGGGGLEFVTTDNSDSITLEGLGTQVNPLTANLIISSITSNALSITTAGGGGVYVADLSEAIANKLDKVQTDAQSVESEVDFNGVTNLNNITNAQAPINANAPIRHKAIDSYYDSNGTLQGFIYATDTQGLVLQADQSAVDEIHLIDETFVSEKLTTASLQVDGLSNQDGPAVFGASVKLNGLAEETPIKALGRNALNEVVEFTPTDDGENNTSSNSGVGVGLALPKVGVDLPFKSLVAGSNVNIESQAEEVVISASGTTAGISQKVYFTADLDTVNTTWYQLSDSDKGTTPSAEQQVLLAANTNATFTEYYISGEYGFVGEVAGGDYEMQLVVEVDNNNGNQRYEAEFQLVDADGVSNAVLLSALDSGVLDIQANNPTQIKLTGNLPSSVPHSATQRVRVMVKAYKVGGSNNTTFSVWSGSSYESFIEVPVSITSDAVTDLSSVNTGGTQTQTNNILDANKLDKLNATNQSVESEVEFKNGVEVSGALANGSAITMPDNSWIRPSTDQGGVYLTNGIDPNTMNSTIHFLNSGLSLFSGDGVNQFGSMLMGNTQLYLSHSVANVAKDSLILGNEGLSLQTTTGRGLYVTSTNLELSNTTSNISFNTSGLRFNGFNGGYEFINVPTGTLAYTYGENASGDLVKGTGGGGGSQDLQSVTDLGDTTTNGATFGGVVNADKGIVANTNDSDQYPLKIEQSPLASAVHFSSKGNGYQTWVGLRGNGTRRSTLGTTPNGSGTQWKLELYDSSGLNPISVFDVRYDRNLTINKNLEVPRLLQGSVADDGTTGIQCEELRVEGDVVLDAIPTGAQVGLVGYDSNGKLIQGVGGGGGVTPTAWVNASLNSSLGVRSSMRPLRYRGDGIDGVQIEGSCKYNTGLALFPGFTVVLFTLPIGSRPNKDINLTVQVGYNGAVPQVEAWASLNSTNGQVTLKNSDSVAISELYDITINTRFSLI
jgi:hypothetical protein